MNKPSSKKPYSFDFNGYSINFGDISNIDISLLQSLIKVKERDRQRHFIEWLEYDLHLAKQGLKELENE